MITVNELMLVVIEFERSYRQASPDVFFNKIGKMYTDADLLRSLKEWQLVCESQTGSDFELLENRIKSEPNLSKFSIDLYTAVTAMRCYEMEVLWKSLKAISSLVHNVRIVTEMKTHNFFSPLNAASNESHPEDTLDTSLEKIGRPSRR